MHATPRNDTGKPVNPAATPAASQPADTSARQPASQVAQAGQSGQPSDVNHTDNITPTRAAAVEPMSPAGNHRAADKKMDDDTGLSNTANQAPEPPHQDAQSNVGRRSDGTPD